MKAHRHHVLALLGMLFAAMFSPARARADDNAKLVREAQETITTFKRTDPGLVGFMQRSVGYAVFPDVGKGGLGVGGAHGTGVLFDRAGRPLGKATLTQVTVGLQAGGQTYSEIIFFATPNAMAEFESGNFAFAAQASAVALKSGASANAKFENGVAVFTATKGGLMFETSVGGQKFKFEPFAPRAR
jgi:lipid-binding SYLF domain-containing protein